MTIGIVLHPYGEDKPGGLARVIFEWTKALLERDSKNEYIIYLRQRPQKPPSLPGRWKLEVLGGNLPFLWLERLRNIPKADVYIFNTPVLPPFWRPPKSILVVYDFPYKYLPPKNFLDWFWRFFISWYHKRSLERTEAIAAVSESSKGEIIKFFGISPEKIKVVWHGFKNICEIPPREVALPEKFFFFAGTLKERKNVLNIARAFGEFKVANPTSGHKLVLGGKSEGEYFEKIKDFSEKSGLRGEVLFLGHLSDTELSYVYRRAEALVFPSLVEATGNPILEAMACGLPVITSNIQGPAELAGEAGVLVNPEKPAEIAKAMERVAFDLNFRKELIRRGYEQAQKFSWDNIAPRMFKILDSLQ